jgi:hypothetical protein
MPIQSRVRTLTRLPLDENPDRFVLRPSVAPRPATRHLLAQNSQPERLARMAVPERGSPFPLDAFEQIVT